jgi:TPR repeat protein
MAHGEDSVVPRQFFEKAAVQGSVEAQYNLARLYYSGQDGKPDYAQACLWYEKAAHQGSNLGCQ